MSFVRQRSINPNEIIVTVGATEAINLCLQAVAKPGDMIAVELSTFYAMLRAVERMRIATGTSSPPL